jgi:hypothetical protein
MKYSLLSFFYICALCSSCGSSNTKQLHNENYHDPRDTFIHKNVFPIDSFQKSTAIWSADTNFKMTRLRNVNSDTLTPEKLISILNLDWNYVRISSYRISHDTIFVAIPFSNVLTQQMGTTGAIQYLSVATFTLTELPGIKYVHFNFEEGDHASPGTYSR